MRGFARTAYFFRGRVEKGVFPRSPFPSILVLLLLLLPPSHWAAFFGNLKTLEIWLEFGWKGLPEGRGSVQQNFGKRWALGVEI